MKMDSVNSRILHVFIAMGVLFAGLILMMTWFELWGKNAVMSSSFNRRLMAEEAQILRGSVLDRNDTVLALSEGAEGARVRVYPYGNLYAHVLGYDSLTYGKTLLEARYNDALLGRDGLTLINRVGSLISGDRQVGHSLTLTLDHALQKKARELLGGSRGAVVALDPATGEVLAMVSTPDYDPNGDRLEERWPALIEDENSPLLPRAVMGLYPPGSTFKVVTAAAALEKGLGDRVMEDPGSIVIDGKTVSNAGGKAYGEIDMARALAVSSNVYFAKLAEELGAPALTAQAGRAGIGSRLAFDIPASESRMGSAEMGQTELAATGIGQGKLLVTPLQMALLSAGIANDGVIMKPYLVSGVTDASGRMLKGARQEVLHTFTDPATAGALTDMMTGVVKSGTGTRAKISGIAVAGKTGTAQNEKSSQGEGFDHAWFIGFAPAENPRIAVAVLLEYQGKGGGQAAAPIAGKLMSAYLKGKQ